MPFIPHTEADVKGMLGAIGAPSIDALFDEIPAALRCGPLKHVPEGLPEMQVSRLMSERAALDGGALNFIGAGAYEHHIPAAVWEITTRGEFYSAYTPYQAEASQGTLQVLYEYQTMMTALTGMEVSNASMYDGASALGEALLMALRANRKNGSGRVLMPRTVHPYYLDVVRATTPAQGIAVEYLDYCPQRGVTLADALKAHEGSAPTAVVIQQPNFFGQLEDVDAITDWAQAQGALVVAVVNPVSLALLKPPGEWGAQGADIVCGDGQPLGSPLSSGGPYFGFMTTKMAYVREMPGRIVGRTVDLDGKPGFTLTLQAREQHIRRAKAKSNICTNQGLLVTAATIHMSLLGPEGLEQVASASMANTRKLVEALISIPGVTRVFEGAGFHEAVIRLPQPVAPLLERLSQHEIFGGFDLSAHHPQLGNALLVCATETKTGADIETYRRTLAELLA
ncbi:MAG: aminomethyl-transferring glycine dehydrogenase subunit GcvPA [Sinimarinibacterium flocculans]|uniref:aminomethyl-transferring glycine dehydrogenase subunit GcvPA n=1 Tax=Sinimarinibacterium flocculans TaxID=985250 RepID=UPI003C4E830E